MKKGMKKGNIHTEGPNKFEHVARIVIDTDPDHKELSENELEDQNIRRFDFYGVKDGDECTPEIFFNLNLHYE